MLLLGLGLVSFVCLQLGLAQSLQPSPTSSSTSSSAAPTHTLSVGAEGHVFTPSSVTANVGDFVEFLFYPLNHSVARAEFKKPCIPYEVSGVGKQGFWSGFHPLNVVASNPPAFLIKINDTQPIFFYCSAPGACIDGMIGAINPNSTQTLDIQEDFARNSTLAFSPGENFPAEVAPSSTQTSSVTSSASGSPTSTSTPTAAAAASESKPPLSGGAIAGITIGGAAVALMAGALFYMCGRQQILKEMIPPQREQSHPASPFINHASMASASAYPNKMFDGLDVHRFSGQPSSPGYCDHSRAETERSRSPAIDEGTNLDPALGGSSSALGNGPTIRRSMPARASDAPQIPLTLVDTSIFQARTGEAPGGPMPQRLNSHRGAHELPVESEVTSPQWFSGVGPRPS
ncbi:uncharacterized protein BP5553_07727 [Venustampulla echinocandica]|uniref:Cupredoxin n=1 Tax=Venustampulla echinocandica TaxID=2656787 RepID=A0A370THC6_9HELO|nr:uncharacterized protein BP5553_07727 [Venustampulla echinocandica]RDL34599.1 hypothetical protein BP5553_07727 [Venustampulla echinocandica]